MIVKRTLSDHEKMIAERFEENFGINNVQITQDWFIKINEMISKTKERENFSLLLNTRDCRDMRDFEICIRPSFEKMIEEAGFMFEQSMFAADDFMVLAVAIISKKDRNTFIAIGANFKEHAEEGFNLFEKPTYILHELLIELFVILLSRPEIATNLQEEDSPIEA